MRWSDLVDVGVGLLSPFWTPSSSVFWLYLLAATAVAALRWDRRSGLAGHLFPASTYRHASVRHDLGFFLVNALFYSFVLLGPLAAATEWAYAATWRGLEGGLGPVGHAWSGTAAKVALTVALLVSADLAFFVSHLLQHKVGVLWEFHKVHHSAPVLVPLTVFRRHPVDVLVERGIASVAAGVVLGVFGWAGAATIGPYEVLGVNVGLFLFLLAGFNLQHSHVWWSWGRGLEHVLVSPALHQIHHSAERRHHDKNLGNVFALWDWAAGTLYVPAGRERFELGLSGRDRARFGSLARLYLLPFVDAARAVVGATRKRTLLSARES